MRQVTCFKMAIDGEGVKFLHSLSTKLAGKLMNEEIELTFLSKRVVWI